MSPWYTDVNLGNRSPCDIRQSTRLVDFTSTHAIGACDGHVHFTLLHRVCGKALARRDLYQSPGYVLLYVIKFVVSPLLTFSDMYGGSDDGYRPLSDPRHHSSLRQ
jgi:hypothetical protein